MVIDLLYLKLTHANINVLGITPKAFPFPSDSFFPQMRPEKFEQKKTVELAENEKVIFDIISLHKSMNLNDLKDKSGLSNKQWDKGIKALGQLGLTKVTKIEDNLMVDLIEE